MKNKNITKIQEGISTTSEEYKSYLISLKAKIRQAQYEASRSVNKQLITLYMEIGESIVTKQQEYGWGKGIVEAISQDLQQEFQGQRGYSVQNLWYMRKFCIVYREATKLQSLIGEISWTHHLAILDKCKDDNEERNVLRRKFYIEQTIEHKWSVRVLKNYLDSELFEKTILNQTNFMQALSEEMQGEALFLVKDEYDLSFVGLGEEFKEREIEDRLIDNIEKTLMAFGNYFTFVGRQYRVEVSDKEYFIDILLFHRKLQCLVVVELKAGEFKPEYVGKLNFYLSVLNDNVKLKDENSSVGILLCKQKDRVTVEYSLNTSKHPIGVGSYKTTKTLPSFYDELLPSVEEIEKQLNNK